MIFVLQCMRVPQILERVNLQAELVSDEESGGLLLVQESDSLTESVPTSALPSTKD